jgi:methylmalonyl-CoA/ethylmalonyl-CoA epimerase
MKITLMSYSGRDDSVGSDRTDCDGGKGSGTCRRPGSILYFKVDDSGHAYADLKGRGVDFRDEPHLIAKMPDHELWMAFFRDGEGNTLALMHEKRG